MIGLHGRNFIGSPEDQRWVHERMTIRARDARTGTGYCFTTRAVYTTPSASNTCTV